MLKNKIYFIVNARMPTERAHGIQLIKMCEAFLDQGVDLELIVPNRQTTSCSIKDFYGLRRDIPFRKLPVIDCYRFGKVGFALGSFTFAVSYLVYFIGKLIRGENNCIIYTVDLDQISFCAIPLLGFSYFMEVHEAHKRIWYSFFLKKIKGIITINQLLKERLIQDFKLATEKIIIQPNGIDLRFFSPNISKNEARGCLGLPLDKKLVVYTGKFYKWKGLDVFPLLAEEMPNFLIYLVGGTNEELNKFVQIDKMPNNLICVGHEDYKKIPLWLIAADVIAVLGTKQNEYSYYYTSPMKIFEYMAARRPIVASRTPATEQVVSENEVNFYEPDNAKDMGRAIVDVVNNRTTVNEKIEKAYQKVQNFTWEKRAKNILSFIKSKI